MQYLKALFSGDWLFLLFSIYNTFDSLSILSVFIFSVNSISLISSNIVSNNYPILLFFGINRL